MTNSSQIVPDFIETEYVQKVFEKPTHKIYKMISIFNDYFYVGSTKGKLNERFNCHKSVYRRKTRNNEPYKLSLLFENGEDTVLCVLLEEYSLNSKLYSDSEKRRILHERERKWIEKLNSKYCLNQAKPIVYNEEIKQISKSYYQRNRDIILTKRRKQYLQNRNKYLDRCKEYYNSKKNGTFIKKYKGLYKSKRDYKATNDE